MESNDKIVDIRAFNIKDAAQYVGVSQNTIRNWVNSGVLPYESLPGSGKKLNRFIRIRKSDLDDFLDKSRKYPNRSKAHSNALSTTTLFPKN